MDLFPDTRNSLIGQAVEGNMKVLSALATNYSPAIRALVNRKWGERPDRGRDDLVQEILKEICLPGRLAQWKTDKGRFRQWICGIAGNIISGAYRREGAQKRGGDLERMSAETLDSVARPYSKSPSGRRFFGFGVSVGGLQSAPGANEWVPGAFRPGQGPNNPLHFYFQAESSRDC